MITTQQKTEIKKLLGHRYSSAIQSKLLKNGLLNKDGKIYSPAQIANVMNGVNHYVIEDVIWEMVAEKKQIVKKREAILKQ